MRARAKHSTPRKTMKMSVMDETGAGRKRPVRGSATATRSGSGPAESRSRTGTIGVYLDEIGRFDLLSAEEEVDLANRVKSGDEGAREVLINANLRLVV